MRGMQTSILDTHIFDPTLHPTGIHARLLGETLAAGVAAAAFA
jgi:hypothetical protein